MGDKVAGERILVVEDEARIARIVAAYLERDGYRVQQASDGRQALEIARADLPDLIVLDLMLPLASGWGVCRELRQNPRTAGVPIIMATARDEVVDRIVGLELGADDYVIKPYDAKELVARVHAVLRRVHPPPAPPGGPGGVLERGDLVIDRDRYEVRRGREVFPLTRSEFEILATLAVVVLVGIGGVAVLANARTTVLFEHYLLGGGSPADRQFAEVAAIVYRDTGTWTAVTPVLRALPGPPGGRIIVVDRSGRVVSDTGTGPVPRALSAYQSARVQENGQTVATLYTVPPADSPRLLGLSPSDRAFLRDVNQSLVLGALAAIAMALVLGTVLARQIIRPVRDLSRGAQRIAHGHLDERIQVRGEDEVAQLGHAFNEMAESLQRTENARRQLVADVAHELRTPLMVIGATVEAIQDGVLPADGPNLTTIRGEVAALSRLVADLRDLSLGDVGQFPLEREPLDLAEVLDAVAAGFAPTAAAQGTTLAIDFAPDLPWVDGDEGRLQQCVRNLLDNALRHTPPGGTVTLRAVADGDDLLVAVIDTGEGIAAEHLPHLFERFFRADASRSRRSGGSGLGLAIVQQIVLAHGGTIQVTSDGPGRGATFCLRFPGWRPPDRAWNPSCSTSH
jgi:signal transduction histidine kinase/DNA-binding response OmpR family regulator